MSTKKIIYLNSQNVCSITCKRCERAQSFDMTGKDCSKKYLMRCKKCNRSFKIQFEQRKEYRKDTDLAGTFFINENIKGYAKIINISKNGIRFRLTRTHPRIEIGMSITLKFRLDNAQRSNIKLDGKVMNRNEKSIGIKATNINNHIQKAIGFYLM